MELLVAACYPVVLGRLSLNFKGSTLHHTVLIIMKGRLDAGYRHGTTNGIHHPAINPKRCISSSLMIDSIPNRFVFEGIYPRIQRPSDIKPSCSSPEFDAHG